MVRKRMATKLNGVKYAEKPLPFYFLVNDQILLGTITNLFSYSFLSEVSKMEILTKILEFNL
jgi:hypothetical protein